MCHPFPQELARKGRISQDEESTVDCVPGVLAKDVAGSMCCALDICDDTLNSSVLLHDTYIGVHIYQKASVRNSLNGFKKYDRLGTGQKIASLHIPSRKVTNEGL
eukprot:5376828-Pyramimonas_sp.AAC.2